MFSLALALASSCVVRGTSTHAVQIAVDGQHTVQVHGAAAELELGDTNANGVWIDVDGAVRASGRTTGPFWLAHVVGFDGARVDIRAARHLPGDRWSLDVRVANLEIDGVEVACGDVHFGDPPPAAPTGTSGPATTEMAAARDELVVRADPSPGSPSLRVHLWPVGELFPTPIDEGATSGGFAHVAIGFSCGGGAIAGWVPSSDLVPYPRHDGFGGGPGCGEIGLGDPGPRTSLHLAAGTVVFTAAGRPWATLRRAGDYKIARAVDGTISVLSGDDFDLFGPLTTK